MWDERTERTLAPGAISALLAEIARLPPTDERVLDRRLVPGARVVDRFELVRELGRGGFGRVFEARDLLLGRTVAFKALCRPRSGKPPEHPHHEAEAVARLAHPNIVQIFDAGTADTGPYLVLELLRGETLEARLARGPLRCDDALEVAIDVARALAHAHAAGVLHRDLKPSNVFLAADGGVKVLDFGLARLLGRGGGPDGGTPGFMSPERRRGEHEDERSDVWALGVLLHLMLGGALPLATDGAPPRPAPPPGVDGAAGLAPLVARMLAADPSARPRDGAAALEALLAVAAGSAPAAAASPASRRRRVTLGLVAIAAVVATVGGIFPPEPPVPEPAPGDRLLVAVADVANETGDRDLDALSGLLITSLEQSRRLAVLTRSRLLDVARQLGRAPVERIDEGLGREVARVAGARALLLASVHRFDDVYTMELRAVEPSAETYLFTVRARVDGRAAIPDLIDELSEETRRLLRERDADRAASRTRVRESVTESLEAYRHYFEARRLDDTAFDFDRALAGYRAALAADPGFALPHLQIAIMSDWHEAPEEDPAWHLAEAARDAERLPEKERKLILAWKARQDGRYAEAVPLARELAAAYPLEKEVLYVAGEIAWHSGLADGPEEGAAYFGRALDLDPTHLVSMIHFLQWQRRRGAAAEGVRRAREAVRVRPEPMTLAMLARAYAYAGDADAALAEARRAAQLAGGAHFEVSYALAEVLGWAGRRTEAEAELARWLESGASAGQRRLALEALPIALAADGRRREALRRFDSLTGTGCASRCDTFDEMMKVHLLLAGDVAAAREELRGWEPPDESEAEPHLWLWPYLGVVEGARRAERLVPGSLWERRHAGAAALRRGDHATAIEILSALAPRDPALETEFMLGEALLAAGRAREALAPLREVADTYPMYAPRWQASFAPRALYLLARAHAALGEHGEAREALSRLEGRWRSADPDVPLLAEARALRRELARRPTP